MVPPCKGVREKGQETAGKQSGRNWGDPALGGFPGRLGQGWGQSPAGTRGSTSRTHTPAAARQPEAHITE